MSCRNIFLNSLIHIKKSWSTENLSKIFIPELRNQEVAPT